jgi:hypothetical protein
MGIVIEVSEHFTGQQVSEGNLEVKLSSVTGVNLI